MLLACLVGILLSLSTIVVSSPKMSGTGASGANRDRYDAAVVAGGEGPVHGEVADEEDLEEEAVKVARRAVRQFPEESQGVVPDHPLEPVPITRLSCDCPEVLTKGTLAAIVAALAFLGFFSTSVLLVVSIWILRLLGKQKKSESSDSSRPRPPPPLPRPEHTFGHGRRNTRPYETLHPAHLFRKDPYGNNRMSPEAKYTPENEYVGPSPLPFNPPEGIYARIQSSSAAKIPSAVGSPAFQSGSPGFHGGSPPYPSGSPGFHGGSPSIPSGSPVGSPGSPN